MDALDKVGMGERIKRIRKKAGLRQWQLAELLGTTQSAVHKYEHGVIPEPRRLVELSRLGNTTIEWILTGRHWQNGSQEQDRPPIDVFHLAERLQHFGPQQRSALDEALRIMGDAVEAARGAKAGAGAGLDLADKERIVLEAARRVHRAIVDCVLDLSKDRLEAAARDGRLAEDAPEPKRS